MSERNKSMVNDISEALSNDVARFFKNGNAISNVRDVIEYLIETEGLTNPESIKAEAFRLVTSNLGRGKQHASGKRDMESKEGYASTKRNSRRKY